MFKWIVCYKKQLFLKKIWKARKFLIFQISNFKIPLIFKIEFLEHTKIYIAMNPLIKQCIKRLKQIISMFIAFKKIPSFLFFSKFCGCFLHSHSLTYSLSLCLSREWLIYKRGREREIKWVSVYVWGKLIVSFMK